MQISCDFYIANLGFCAAFVYGDPPFFGQSSRIMHGSTCGLSRTVFAGSVRAREQLLFASITVASVDEIEQLFSNYKTVGVSLSQTLKQEPWGATTFIVADPDGNLILFARPTA